jgi:protease IV
MKKLFIVLGILAALMVVAVSLCVIVFGIRHMRTKDRQFSEPVVLHLDFSQTIMEHIPSDPFQRFTSRGSITLLDLVRTIDHAAFDSDVKGIVADFSEISLGPAQVQEMRNAIERFRESGKYTIAYADTFFVSGTGTVVYYFASAFDEIYMHPTGDVGFLGLATEPLFFGKMLENLGVVSYMDQRYEYKGVANMFNENGYTTAHRESDAKLIDSLFTTIVHGVAQSRDMTVDHVRSLVDQAPFFGREALEARLVDGFRFWDQVETLLEEKSGGKVELIKPDEYFNIKVKPFQTKGEYVIGLVYGLGQVVRGTSSSSVTGGEQMSSGTMMDAFRRIREDGDVDAVIFRVDSPGGSPTASATIDHEVKLTRQAGIPVIVSMGDIAGSGGYYVAMSADIILAQPMTLTGSIGVAGGKLVFGGLMERLGITADESHMGQQALMLSVFRDPTEKQEERLSTMMDRIYTDFIEGVMAGRQISAEEIDAVARGRIWTGLDAHDVKLVDEIGGIHEALLKAKELAGVPEGSDIALRIYPRQKTFMELIRDPDSGFLTGIMESIRTLSRIVSLVDNLTGNELKILEDLLSNEPLTVSPTVENIYSWERSD